MSRARRSLGREGEERAARHLEARGYQIVARNVRAARVEIDLIVRGRGAIVFVEVKTRRRDSRGVFGRHASAAEAVDARKQARLRRGAAAWLAEHPEARRGRTRVRFDVITCLRDERFGVLAPRNDDTAHPHDARWSIEHWEAAF
ncbi:MAG: YraN family protein [bacterium]|nr:YraN family protein [bacterium]